MYFAFGNNVPADFDGLKDRRVAVVVAADSSPSGAGSVTDVLARQIEYGLSQHVKKIKLISHEEVADWRDQNGDPHDYREIGKGVDAESLLVVEIEEYRLQEGSTLYKGQVRMNLTVYDMNKAGRIAWEDYNAEFSFPIQGGVPITELSREKFQTRVLAALSKDVVKHFYAYDVGENFGSDTRSLH